MSRKSTKYWQRNKNDKGTKRHLPSFITAENGWTKIEDIEEVKNVLPPTVIKNVLDNFEDFDVWVHEQDIYFTQGIYGKLKEQLLKQFGVDLKVKLYDENLRAEQMSFVKLLNFCTKHFKKNIVVDYKNKKLTFTKE